MANLVLLKIEISNLGFIKNRLVHLDNVRNGVIILIFISTEKHGSLLL